MEKKDFVTNGNTEVKFFSTKGKAIPDTWLEEELTEIYERDSRRWVFKEYLTQQEEREFLFDQNLVDKAQEEVIKKYNKLVSDRLSRLELIAEINKHSENIVDQKTDFDNKTLQAILNSLNKVIQNKMTMTRCKFNSTLSTDPGCNSTNPFKLPCSGDCTEEKK